MTRTFVAAVLLATSPMLTAGAAGAAPANETKGCVEPVPQRSYDDSHLTYRLAVDFSGCDWWHGGPITLDATLSRLDGQGEVGSDSLAMCASPTAALPAPQDGQAQSAETPAATFHPAAAGDADDRDGDAVSLAETCDVSVGLEHPAVEAALYRGQVTYPWEGRDRTIGFTALCGPQAGCVDLPADPTPVLAPLAGLGSGDGDAG
jgi:hypothetical protein